MGWVVRGRNAQETRLLRREKARYRRSYGMIVPAVALLAASAFYTQSVGDSSTPANGRQLLSATSCTPWWSDNGDWENNGGVILYFMGEIFLFLGIAIVCDDFFVASLEMISEKLGLSEDVAGATFMAAGSSAPELFSSTMSLVSPTSGEAIGIGTIVGSAVFNILIIVGATAVCTGHTLDIDWKPLTRDCFFYLLAVLSIIVIFNDDTVYWWEGGIAVGAYLVYIMFMSYNPYFMEVMDAWGKRHGLGQTSVAPVGEEDLPEHTESHQRAYRTSFSEESKDRRASGVKTRTASTASRRPSSDGIETLELEQAKRKSIELKDAAQKEARSDKEMEDYKKLTDLEAGAKALDTPQGAGQEEEEEEEGSPFEMPEDWKERPMWFLSLFWYAAFTVTIPKCQEPRWEKWYFVSFTTSILWLGFISYIMVEWAAKLGCILSIPDIVMGNTLIAAGTSIPDALSSIVVAKQGMGDMAVANAVGSNVFDIWLGLGLPWLCYLPFDGGKLEVDTGDLLINIFILLAVLVVYYGSIMFSGWKLTVLTGKIFMFCHLFYIGYNVIFVWLLKDDDDSDSI
mmetsp:Transcript_26826/g.58458  ORF Transcript_26826/g.58458 Transcript_26826/m.58458 type:complete len:570 (-) Transcript_26826:108-1817(-)